MALLQEAAIRPYHHTVSHREHLRVVSIPETIVYSFLDHKLAKEKSTQPETLGDYVAYFDNNWRQEGLSKDWYTLGNKVGFSMQTQMNLLQGMDGMSVAAWKSQTKQDILGFNLEYLSNHLVYPVKYELDDEKGTMIEPKYKKDITETVSKKERNGAVTEALHDMKDFFLNGGTLAVLPSPSGPSGLIMDNGQAIDYPDSYWFIMHRTGDTVTNYTIKTDFSHKECQEAIRQLSGKEFSEDNSLEAYSTAGKALRSDSFAYKTPGEIIDVLASVRHKSAFEKIGWNEIRKDIKNADKLYEFGDQTTRFIREFEEYDFTGDTTKLALQKALAATILRISKLFIEEEQQKYVTRHQGEILRTEPFIPMTFGRIMHEVAQRPGCAGGGKNGSSFQSNGKTVVESVTSRVGTTEQEWFNCPECPFVATGPIGNTCPSCGLTQEAFAAKTGVKCE